MPLVTTLVDCTVLLTQTVNVPGVFPSITFWFYLQLSIESFQRIARLKQNTAKRLTGCPSFGICTTVCFDGVTLICLSHNFNLSKFAIAKITIISCHSFTHSFSSSSLVTIKLKKKTNIQKTVASSMWWIMRLCNGIRVVCPAAKVQSLC